MANTVVNGTDIAISIAGLTVARAKSHTITINTEMRDTSSKSSGNWKETAKGRFTWSGSVDGLVDYTEAGGTANYEKLVETMLAGAEVEIISATTVVGGFVLTGMAILTSVELSAGDAENATYSCSFEGSGELVKTTVSV